MLTIKTNLRLPLEEPLDLARALYKGLCNIQKTEPDQISDLASYCAHLLAFIYENGSNDAKLSLHEVTKSFDQRLG